MPRCRASLIALSLACAGSAGAQEVDGKVGYAHIFRAGGFSFATGYRQALSAVTSPLQHRVGGDFWYANTDIASLTPGNASRNLVGLGARYEIEVTRCCGRLHPLMALPVQVLHSSVPVQPTAAAPPPGAALRLVPVPESSLPAEDRSGSAWGWSAGVELGLRVSMGDQWHLQTSGTALYQDIYAQSTTHGAWIWHLGLGYRFGGRSAT
jgi:hypothetical protein